MKFVSNMLKKIETKSKHDLVKTMIGTLAGFVVAKIVENAYDSAFELTESNTTTSTDN